MSVLVAAQPESFTTATKIGLHACSVESDSAWERRLEDAMQVIITSV